MKREHWIVVQLGRVFGHGETSDLALADYVRSGGIDSEQRRAEVDSGVIGSDLYMLIGSDIYISGATVVVPLSVALTKWPHLEIDHDY